MRRRCLVVFLIAAATFSTGDDKLDQAKAILKRADDISDLRTPDVAPYELQANVKVDGPGRSVVGTYHLLWVSPTKWREELNLPGYQEVRFGGEGKMWRVRPPQIRYVPATAAFNAAHRGVYQLPEHAKIKKIVDRTQDGIPVTCIRVVGGWEAEFCVDRSRGVLVWEQSMFDGQAYSDFEDFRGKLVPHSFGVRSGPSVAAFNVTKIEALPRPDPKLFVPPAGAEEWEFCDHPPTPPKPLRTPPPAIRPAFGRSGKESEAVFVLVITKSGDVGDLALARSAYPNMDKEVIDALSKWKYRPAMCGDRPIPVEAIIKINHYQSAFQ